MLSGNGGNSLTGYLKFYLENDRNEVWVIMYGELWTDGPLTGEEAVAIYISQDR